MRSWLAGFLVFSIAYAGLVFAIFAYNWPSLASPHLYRTLEGGLSDPGSIVKVIKNRQQFDISERYAITDQSFELENGSLVTTIAVINGDVIVLTENTSQAKAKEIAEEYIGLIQKHVTTLGGQRKVQMLQVILIPLTTLTFFMFLARWVWRLVGRLN